MPNVFEDDSHRFYFFSNETAEQPRVHVDRDNVSATFALQPVALITNSGYNPEELRRLETFLFENQQRLREKWNRFHV